MVSSINSFQYYSEKELFNLDLDNLVIENCYFKKLYYPTITYQDLLLTIYSYLQERYGTSELINMSNYPSFFECDNYHDNYNICFNFENLNNRTILNEVFELVRYNNLTLSFVLKNHQTNNDYYFQIM